MTKSIAKGQGKKRFINSFKVRIMMLFTTKSFEQEIYCQDDSSYLHLKLFLKNKKSFERFFSVKLRSF